MKWSPIGTLGELIVHKSFGGGVVGSIHKCFKYWILPLLIFNYLFFASILAAILQIHIGSGTDETSGASANQYQNQAQWSLILIFLWPVCQLRPYFNGIGRCMKKQFQETAKGRTIWGIPFISGSEFGYVSRQLCLRSPYGSLSISAAAEGWAMGRAALREPPCEKGTPSYLLFFTAFF